jgi:hypothetical protein
MLCHNQNLGTGFTVFIIPAFLFEAAYHTDAPAFPSIVISGISKAAPGLDVEIGHFLFHSVIPLEVAV